MEFSEIEPSFDPINLKQKVVKPDSETIRKESDFEL